MSSSPCCATWPVLMSKETRRLRASDATWNLLLWIINVITVTITENCYGIEPGEGDNAMRHGAGGILDGRSTPRRGGSSVYVLFVVSFDLRTIVSSSFLLFPLSCPPSPLPSCDTKVAKVLKTESWERRRSWGRKMAQWGDGDKSKEGE